MVTLNQSPSNAGRKPGGSLKGWPHKDRALLFGEP
jgi:hypothetical protein